MQNLLVVLVITFLLMSPAEAQRSSGGRSSPTTTAPRLTSPGTTGLGSSGANAPSTTTPTNPQSLIAPPAPRAQQIAPLSPSLPTGLSTGGTAPNSGTSQGSLALSPGASSSESAPSQPGGGGKTLHDCMNFWDRQTHMTKAEWREACKRTMQEYPTVR